MIEDDLELAEILTEFLEQFDFKVRTEDDPVITSYSIHYTKLYDEFV